MFNTEKDAILFAIRREIEAFLTYKKLSEIVTSQDIKVLFVSLSNDENIHRESLEKLFNEQFGKRPIIDAEGIRVEIPDDFDKAYALKILDTAMEKEREASRLYRQFADESTNESLKRLFMRFADMEDGHFDALQAERNRMIDEYYWFNQNIDRSRED